MRVPTLLRLAFLLLPCAAAHADTFTTTITGGGNTLVFPNVGGPSNYTYFSRVSQIDAEPLYVYVNGGPITQGRLIFTLATSSNYQDLSFFVPAGGGQPAVGATLFGPDLITTVPGIGFYAAPGTYNLTDSLGTPYTYVVTDISLTSVPEPSTLSFLALAAAALYAIQRRRPRPTVRACHLS